MSAPRAVTYSQRASKHPKASRALAVAGFPVLVTAFIGTLIAAIEAGSDPVTTMAALVLAAYAIIAVLERVLPYRDSWLNSRGDLRTDTAWFATNGLLNRMLEPPVLAAAALGAARLSGWLGAPMWPADWPWLAQLALALLIAEFFEYWFHRLMHENAFLWRFHATHHSAPRLYWLNAVRFHAVDYIMVGIVKLVPLALLGAGVEIFALVNLFAAVHGSYQHANRPVRLGPLNWIFSMTELHRWHHSRFVSEANHNYGGNLILWDIVFNTRWLPIDREPPEDIGMEEMPDFPTGYFQQLLSPLRWASLRSAAAESSASPTPR
jgi:sterol desaturase/sphingolipid hydroxylase (fatty acid hydroxylase superfamily)